MGMFDSIEVPTMLCECEAWALNGMVKKRMDVLERKCLRTAFDMRKID